MSGKEKIVQTARELVGVSKWRLGAKPEEAPEFFDCSSFIQWLYKQSGVTLPRLAHQQFEALGVYGNAEEGYGHRYSISEARKGDLLFVSSPYVRGIRTKNQTRLHVCLVTGNDTVICATNSELGIGVVEIPIRHLLKTRQFRGVGRIEDL